MKALDKSILAKNLSSFLIIGAVGAGKVIFDGEKNLFIPLASKTILHLVGVTTVKIGEIATKSFL